MTVVTPEERSGIVEYVKLSEVVAFPRAFATPLSTALVLVILVAELVLAEGAGVVVKLIDSEVVVPAALLAITL